MHHFRYEVKFDDIKIGSVYSASGTIWWATDSNFDLISTEEHKSLHTAIDALIAWARTMPGPWQSNGKGRFLVVPAFQEEYEVSLNRTQFAYLCVRDSKWYALSHDQRPIPGTLPYNTLEEAADDVIAIVNQNPQPWRANREGDLPYLEDIFEEDFLEIYLLLHELAFGVVPEYVG